MRICALDWRAFHCTPGIGQESTQRAKQTSYGTASPIPIHLKQHYLRFHFSEEYAWFRKYITVDKPMLVETKEARTIFRIETAGTDFLNKMEAVALTQSVDDIQFQTSTNDLLKNYESDPFGGSTRG